MDDCIFCKIIKGEIPSYKIYEDEDILVFLDINPSTNGDALIIPKKHFANIDDISIDTLIKIDEIKKSIYKMFKEKLKCEGLTFAQNNDLGQDIKHFHVHATPRYTDDLIEHNFNKDVLRPIEEVFNTFKN